MSALKSRPNASSALLESVRGILMMVDGEVRKDSLPLETDAVNSLIHEVGMLASCYSEGGLPPKTFFAQFTTSSLLVLFTRRSTLIIWMEPAANVSEVEKAGRKLVSTAHLSGAHRTETVLLPPVQEHNATAALERLRARKAPHASSKWADDPADFVFPAKSKSHKMMSWTEARNDLESILTKVLTQAQATRMIERALETGNVDAGGPFDLDQFQEIGHDLLLKIPNRIIRQSLTSEFEALVASMS